LLDGELSLPPQKKKGSTAAPLLFGPCPWPTAGWIKMPRGKEVGLGPDDIVLDGETTLPKREQPPIFGACLLRPNGWMDQHATWYGDRLRSTPRCVRWGPISPPNRGLSSPQFSTHVCWGKITGWIKMSLGTEAGLGPGNIVLDPAPPGSQLPPPNFRPMSCGE